LGRFPDRVVNLHLGLSPYYRGTATNFWPLVHGQPECVGATLHLAILKVDAGPILAQVRPEPCVTDRAHDLGCKTIMAAAEAWPAVLRSFAAGQLAPRVIDSGGGRLCRRRDFNAAAVLQMWQRFDDGMMDQYVADR